MNKIELTPSELNLILSVFRKSRTIEKAILFGSRAKGTAKPNSDIDIAIDGSLDALNIELIANELDELPLPYKFDILSLNRINNADLLEHIHRVGKAIYIRDEKVDNSSGNRIQ